MHRWSALGHGAKSGSNSSAPAKQCRPLPQHTSLEGWDKCACRSKTSIVQLNSMHPNLGILLTMYSGPWLCPTGTTDREAE
jgi:hypothetical protein